MPSTTAPAETANLPALELSERKSAATVAEISTSFTPSQIVVKEFGNLTFILSPANRLSLVDELGRQVPGFDAINDLIIVNWDEIRAGYDTDPYTSRQTPNPNKFTQLTNAPSYISTASSVKNIVNCPTDLQPFLREYIRIVGRNNIAPTPDRIWRVGNPDQTHQVVIKNDFILFQDEESADFVAYIIADSQKQALPPPEWRRFDTKNIFLRDLPSDIVKQIDNLKERVGLGIKNVKGVSNYNLLVQNDKITVVKSGNPISQVEFTDNVPMVGDNICVDPQNPQVAYYCSTGNATEVVRLKMEGDPSNWKKESIPIKTAYLQISSLQLNPSGAVFMFETGREVILVEKNSFKELKKLPLRKAIFDKQGKIRGVDQNGHFVVIESNLEQVAKEAKKREISQMAAGIDVQGLFQTTPQQKAAEEVTTGLDTEVLLPVRHQQEANFLKMLTRAKSLEEATKSIEVLQVLKGKLLDRGFSDTQVAFITSGIVEAITLRQRVFAQHEAGKLIKSLEPRINPAFVSIATTKRLREELNRLNATGGLLNQETRNQVIVLTQKFDQQVGELYRREGTTIQNDIDNRVNAVRTRLEQMQTRAELNDWRELDLPAIQQDLAALAKESPLEAIEVQKRINQARADIDRVVKSYEDKFRKEYDQIRGKSQEIIIERGALIITEVDGFIARMQDRKFGTREAAEQFISASGTKALLENDIAGLAEQDPDKAKALVRDLKIKIINLLGEVERKAKVRSTGQGDLVQFGEDTLLPKWASKTAETPIKKRVDLVFIVPPDSLRSGINPNQILGNIGVKIIDSTGKVKTVRLFEGKPSETDWQIGLYRKAGVPIPPTIMLKDSFLKLRQDSEDWNRPNSHLKAEYVKLKKQVLEHLQKRPRLNQRTTPYQDNPVWRSELEALNQEYAQFVVDHHILFLDRIDQIQREPLPAVTNGKGLVAKWNTSWTRDEYTEEKLVEIVKYMKIQLAQEKGLILLEGHAGTGKDVCIDMISSLLERPLFSYNCSKWTTEEDLTEVLLLESFEGLPKSIKVPSSVLLGMQTEGAMVYFNEFSALPPPAQVFLNSLADHKRSLSLKTSSGQIIKARDSVVFLASANLGPLYEGTSGVQVAAGSRMTFVHFDYTPLYGKRREDDTNPNPPYSSAGALRIAREVKSLEDLAIETNMERNEFVKIWDQYINKIDRSVDLSKLTPVQKYDLEVILCLVQWGDKLTKAFAKQAGGQASANDLPVIIPLTGREMSSMAYWLSNEISDKEKVEGLIPGRETYERAARALIERFFLSKIIDETHKDEIRKKMQGWTSQKRL